MVKINMIITDLKTWRQDLWDKGWRVGMCRVGSLRFLLWRRAA